MSPQSAALISFHPSLCFLFRAPPHVSPSHAVIIPDTTLFLSFFLLSHSVSFSLQLFNSFNPLWICLFPFQFFFFFHTDYLLTGFRMLFVSSYISWKSSKHLDLDEREFVCIAWGTSQLWLPLIFAARQCLAAVVGCLGHGGPEGADCCHTELVLVCLCFSRGLWHSVSPTVIILYIWMVVLIFYLNDLNI